MFGGKSKPSLRRLANKIGKEVGFLVTPGLVTHYNGLEVVQDRDYVHIHVVPYIEKILNNHGWATAGKDEDRIIEPVHSSSIKEIESYEGPEDPAAAKAIENNAGSKYRTTIGEAIFAYVTCRLDTGYAIAELSKFSTRPAMAHYAAVKRLFQYLRQTRTHGLVYWRPKPLNALPHVPFPHLRPLDDIDRQMPMPSSIDVLCGYIDSEHTNYLRTRRSVGAHVFCLAGTDIAYRAKWVATICLSSSPTLARGTSG
jgi:hypothetical protein